MMKSLIATLMAGLLLSGCWGLRDISELALVLAVGIDRTEAGLVRVTVQIARPAPGGGGTQTGGPSGGFNPARVASAEAPSVFEAIRLLAGSASRRLMWAHNQVVVIGRDQAEHGVKEIVDFFTRNPELRYRTLMVVADGEARSIVAEQTGLETLPGVSIEKNLRYASLLGVAQRVDVKEFAAAAVSDDRSPILPVLELAPVLVPGTAGQFNSIYEVQVAGMAIFREGRLQEILSRSASRGLLLANGEIGRVVVSVPCPEGAGDPITAEVVGARTRIEVLPPAESGLRFHLTVDLRMGLTSLGCSSEYRDPRVRDRLEKELADLFVADIAKLLEVTRTSRTDPIGLGRYVRVRTPAVWRRWSLRWPEGMGAARVQSQVAVSIKGSEVLLRPTQWRKGAGTGE